jgi:hypothetical protein
LPCRRAHSRAFWSEAVGGIAVAIDEVARFSTEQAPELAQFVEQVSPQALPQLSGLLLESPLGVAAFSTGWHCCSRAA